MPQPSPEPGRPPEQRKALAAAAGAGFELLVAVLLGIYGGRWADRTLGTAPWLELGGFLGGVCVGLYELVRSARVPPSGRP